MYANGRVESSISQDAGVKVGYTEDCEEAVIRRGATIRNGVPIYTDVPIGDMTSKDIVLLRIETGTDIDCQSDIVIPPYMNYVESHGTDGWPLTTILDYFIHSVYCEEPHDIFDYGHSSLVSGQRSS